MNAPSDSAVLLAALAYAARDWPVFPCSPIDKKPLVKAGFKDASTDATVIRAWWRRWPRALIGLPTGSRVGFFVIDLDLGDPLVTTAAAYLDRFRAHVGGTIPDTAVSETGSGGLHLCFAWPDDGGIGIGADLAPRLAIPPAEGATGRDGKKAKGAQVDVRGEGGYIIAPPSVRSDGGTYTWCPGPDDGIAPAPEAVLRIARKEEARAARAAAQAAVRPAPAPRSNAKPSDNATRRYALAALAREADELGALRSGRNDRLNVAAMKLGQLASAGALSEGEVRGALETAAERCGLAQDDGWPQVRATFASGFTKGLSEPRDLSEVGARTRAERPALRLVPIPPSDEAEGPETADDPLDSKPGKRRRGPPGETSLDADLAHRPLTDLGNAERFVARFRGKLLFCPATGWLTWDGRRWASDEADAAVQRAEHETVRAIQDEAKAIAGTELDLRVGGSDDAPVMLSDKLAAWGRKSEAASRLSAIGKNAAPYLHVATAQLDADPMVVNVLNGTIEIRKRDDAPYVRLRPHDPADLITKLAPATYDPAATCPLFDAFLLRVQPSPENRRFLDQWGGLSLTGDTGEQKLAFHYGKGRNGKSVHAEAIGHVAGDYAATVPIETFLKGDRSRRGGEATPDLARLPGVRMLRTSEPEKGAHLAEALIKRATGGEPMDARHLNRPFFSFVPIFKLSMQGNYRPKIDGTDEGIWGRLLLIPWPVFIPKEERDKTLPARLKAEASGILNRLLNGLCDWLDNGLVVPVDVERATESYRADSDPIGRFLSHCTRATIGQRVQSTVLHELFSAWARVNGEAPRSQKSFSSALKERGIADLKSGVQWWLDLETTARASDFVDPHGEPLDASQPPSRYRRDE